MTNEGVARCQQDGVSAGAHVDGANEGCHLLFIQCEGCKAAWEGCCSPACFDFTRLPLEEQKQKRKGVAKERNVFNKSKARLRLKPGEQ